MRPSLLLRIAAVLTLLYCAGHSSGMPWTPVTGPDEVAVIDAMKAHQFAFAGATRTFWDFYQGFGIAIDFYLLFQAVMLWLLAGLAKTQPASVRPIVASLAVAFLINGLIVWKYFFAVPLAFAVAIDIVLVLAFVAAGKRVPATDSVAA